MVSKHLEEGNSRIANGSWEHFIWLQREFWSRPSGNLNEGNNGHFFRRYRMTPNNVTCSDSGVMVTF